jgi:hypothetical protein
MCSILNCADTVVCYRTTPVQKAIVVKFVKDKLDVVEDNIKLKKFKGKRWKKFVKNAVREGIDLNIEYRNKYFYIFGDNVLEGKLTNEIDIYKLISPQNLSNSSSPYHASFIPSPSVSASNVIRPSVRDSPISSARPPLSTSPLIQCYDSTSTFENNQLPNTSAVIQPTTLRTMCIEIPEFISSSSSPEPSGVLTSSNSAFVSLQSNNTISPTTTITTFSSITSQKSLISHTPKSKSPTNSSQKSSQSTSFSTVTFDHTKMNNNFLDKLKVFLFLKKRPIVLSIGDGGFNN